MDVAPGRESWTALLGADPLPWLLACDEPSARWVTLTELLDLPSDDPLCAAAHADVLADAGTHAEPRLRSERAEPAGGHGLRGG